MWSTLKKRLPRPASVASLGAQLGYRLGREALRLRRGEISPEEFRERAASHLAGAPAGAVGATVGGAVGGALFGTGAVVGAFAGSVIGERAGQKLLEKVLRRPPRDPREVVLNVDYQDHGANLADGTDPESR